MAAILSQPQCVNSLTAGETVVQHMLSIIDLGCFGLTCCRLVILNGLVKVGHHWFK